MLGFLYAAAAVVFVLGLVAIWAISRHYRASSARPSSTSPSSTSPSSTSPSSIVAGSAAAGAAALRTSESDELRRAAEVEAAATRRAAGVEAAAVREQADGVLTQAREQAAAQLAQAREQSETRLALAAEQVEARLAEARRQGRDELEKVTADVVRQQGANDTRAARLDEVEKRLDAQEARLAERATAMSEYAAELASTKTELEARARDLDDRAAEIADAARHQQRELERVAGLSVDEARAELLATVETTARREAALLVRTIENDARAEGTERARAIVVDAVQRVAGAQTAESVVSVLHLPADEMKGRIIGREGRNIRAFEAVTGVNVLIDDTPEAVLLSCFDPVRREIARVTLDKLVQDGRIHPHRIEEAYEQSKIEVDELCLRAARDAVAEVGVGHIDERLMPTLGRLKYRTSYGQNVLHHLVETAHVAGVMAAELGVEPTLVKRSAFLHDIGKALTHEVEGSHAIVGAELLRKYGEDEAVAHAVEAHHNEVQPRTIEAVLTQAADTCSASRPGARRESVEAYVKRLARIEEIAGARDGVDKVFAMQAGREVRVMVAPSEVDDLAASVLAREIAKQIEDELTYPGQIRVTVVRESRTTEIAH